MTVASVIFDARLVQLARIKVEMSAISELLKIKEAILKI